MTTYRRRPPTVEAVQWSGTNDSEVTDLLPASYTATISGGELTITDGIRTVPVPPTAWVVLRYSTISVWSNADFGAQWELFT